MDLLQLKNIAIQAALSAGKIIQKYKNEDVLVEEKEGGTNFASQIVTVVDRECERAILDHLLPSCDAFNFALLTEETKDNGSRFEKDYFWCIDPMDGTIAFVNKQPGYSVSIALVAKNGTPLIGVVYDPNTDIIYHASKGGGVFKNNNPWIRKNKNKHLTFVTDRKLIDTPRAIEIKTLLNRYNEQFNLNGIKEIAGAGSVLNGILVLENGPACMFKFPKKEKGGGSIWDFAAIAWFYKEFGLPATNFQGGPLDLNRKEGSFMNQQGVFFANFEDRN